MNLADPELELIDPTPDVHSLFIRFDELFFFNKLSSRAFVRWSKRMYSCAGTCMYEGRGGLCNIALSEPLLKLRTRKDLVETLLHEMIHAFLFITNRDNDRDGHGPNFQMHMHRINKETGLDISIYHDFHDEVELYLKHWWRCNGRCSSWSPFFGTVRRSSNRPPGPSDFWWAKHKKNCGGTFIKIPTDLEGTDKTKYANNNTDNTNKNIYKDVNKGKINTNRKTIKIAVPHPAKLPATNPLDKRRSNSNSVIEKVRDVWVNKLIPSQTIAKTQTQVNPTNRTITNKHKADTIHVESPSKKIKKIDDYFKNATSILKDVYGKEFIITQSSKSTKLKVSTVPRDGDKVGPVKAQENLVNCPTCNAMVKSSDINQHLDECLSKDIIEELSKDFIKTTPGTSSAVADNIWQIPSATAKTENPNKTGYAKIKPEQFVGVIQSITKRDKCTNIEFDNRTVETESLRKPQSNNHQNKTKNSDSLQTNIISRPSNAKDLTQTCLSCGEEVNMSMESHLEDCLGFFDNNTTIPEEGSSHSTTVIKDDENIVKKCPFCKLQVNITMEKHLDECFAFFDNNTIPLPIGTRAIETKDTAIIKDTAVIKQPSISKENGVQNCPFCRIKLEIPIENHLDECFAFFDNNTIPLPKEGVFDNNTTVPVEGASTIGTINTVIVQGTNTQPSTSKENKNNKCPFCMIKVEESIEMHLDECLALFDNNTIPLPREGASTIETIEIDDDDDDVFDETQTFNATGTKSPCPCCLKMIEITEMNEHLSVCLSTSFS